MRSRGLPVALRARACACTLGVVAAGLLGSVVSASGAGHASAAAVARLSPLDRQGLEPAVAVDATGDRTVVWIRQEPTEYVQFIVMAATRAAGARSWSAPVAISDTAANPDSAHLAVSAGGAAVITWLDERPEGARHSDVLVLMASYRPSAAAAWQPARQVSPRGQNVGQTAIGIDALGRPLAVWAQGFDPGAPLDAAAGTTDGSWGHPIVLTRHGSSGGADEDAELQLAVNGRGEALAVWQRAISQRPRHPRPFQPPTVTFAVVAAGRGVDGHWAAPRRIGTAIEPDVLPGGNIWTPATPRLALDDRGGATVLWRTEPGQTQTVLTASRPSASTRWSSATTLAESAIGPVLATDAHGDRTATWLDDRGRVLVATSSGGRWSAPVRLAGSAASWTVSLSVNPRGAAIAAWADGHGRELVAFRAGPAGVWQPPVAVGSGEFPVTALDPADGATIAWAHLFTKPVVGLNVIEAAVRAFP